MLLRGRTRRWCITRIWRCCLIRVPLVIGGGRILRGVILCVILTIVLSIVLAVVLLWIVTLLLFLSVVSAWCPVKAPVRWRVLVRIALLLVLRGVDEGHVGSSGLPFPVYGESDEDREDG